MRVKPNQDKDLTIDIPDHTVSGQLHLSHEGIKCGPSIFVNRYFFDTCGISLCESCEQQECHRSDHTLGNIQPQIQSASHSLENVTSKKYSSKGNPTVCFETVRSMLCREDELRKCVKVQEQLKAWGESSYVDVMCSVQAQVAEEFGFSVNAGCTLLQCAEDLFPQHIDEIKELSLYRKYNRCVDGDVKEGDPIPRLVRPLHRLDANLSPINLFDEYSHHSKPLVKYSNNQSSCKHLVLLPVC